MLLCIYVDGIYGIFLLFSNLINYFAIKFNRYIIILSLYLQIIEYPASHVFVSTISQNTCVFLFLFGSF